MKILAVSLAYPPLAYPRSIQVARLLKNTDAETALFCADEPGVKLDPTIEPDAEARLAACVRVPVRRTAKDKLIDRLAHRFARGIWRRRNLVPDVYGNWRTDVLTNIDRFLKTTSFQPDVVVTFAQPFSDHLIGLELKSCLGLPWLAHFSDPWVDNPFSPLDDSTRQQNLALERSVAEKADLLAFTSAETVDLFFRKYPASLQKKARVLPQCYGMKIASPPSETSGPFIVRYLGNFYGHRTPEPLIRALCEIQRTSPEILAAVKFELIGPGNAEEAARLSQGLPDGVLSIRPGVNYKESIDLMSAADGLLVIDAPAEKSVFLPSKLVDYIGAGHPVLTLSPDGTASGLVTELGGIVADPANQDRIIDSIKSFIELLEARRRSGQTGEWGNADVRRRFSEAKIAADFETMLAEIVI